MVYESVVAEWLVQKRAKYIGSDKMYDGSIKMLNKKSIFEWLSIVLFFRFYWY